MSLQQSADSDNTGSASSVNEDADSADSQTSIAERGDTSSDMSTRKGSIVSQLQSSTDEEQVML